MFACVLGTVVVQPEAVLESQPIYNGPEFRHNKKTNKVFNGMV